MLGLLAGFVAMLVGALVWAVFTVLTGWRIGIIAIGIGFLVGMAIRTAGQGYGPLFSGTGAVLALGGCLIGNLWIGAGLLAADVEGGSAISIAINLTITPGAWGPVLSTLFSPIHLLFYGIAAWEGWKLSSLGMENE